MFETALDGALEADDPPLFSVLYMHGPGGIGKSSLLDRFAEVAGSRGATVARVDGRSLIPTPSALLDALATVLDVPAGHGAIASPTDGIVLLIDAYERLVPLDSWLRTSLLPRLPMSAVTVIAGRAPPSEEWRSDPAWRDLSRIVSLRNLTPDETRAYLSASDVDRAQLETLVRVTHGTRWRCRLSLIWSCGAVTPRSTP